MHEDGVAQAQRLALRQHQVARARGLPLEVVDPEGVGRHQAVVAGVPPGGVPRVPGVIEEGHAQLPIPDRPGVVHPRRALPPDLLALDPGAHEGLARGHLALQPQRRGQAQGHAALLGVAEAELAARRADGDLVLEEARPVQGVEPEAALVGADHPSLGIEPLVGREEGAEDRTLDDLADLHQPDPGRLEAAVPEIEAVDVAVGEPHPAVVGVVVRLALHLLRHGPVPGEALAAGAQHRMEEGAVTVAEAVLGDRAAPDADRDRLLAHRDPDAVRGELVGVERLAGAEVAGRVRRGGAREETALGGDALGDDAPAGGALQPDRLVQGARRHRELVEVLHRHLRGLDALGRSGFGLARGERGDQADERARRGAKTAHGISSFRYYSTVARREARSQ